MTTNVMLLEDHAPFRQTLALLIDREPTLKVVAQAGTLSEARRLLTADLDVAIVDLGLPDGSGTDIVKDLLRLNPKSKVLVLSGSLDFQGEASAREAGAAEVLHKAAGIIDVVETVKRLKAG